MVDQLHRLQVMLDVSDQKWQELERRNLLLQGGMAKLQKENLQMNDYLAGIKPRVVEMEKELALAKQVLGQQEIQIKSLT
jgi:hypothetical protein